MFVCYYLLTGDEGDNFYVIDTGEVEVGFCFRFILIIMQISVKTLGVFNASAHHLLADLGRRISINAGEARETSYLFQRISVLVQRFNAVLLHDSLPAADSTD